MGFVTAPYRNAAGSSGVPVRAHSIIEVASGSNASSQVVTFPGSAAAGDYMIIFAGHGFPVNIPSGWTSLNQPSSGSDWNGATFAKTLSSGDISTGSVTVTFTGSAQGIIGYVVHAGAVTGSRTAAGARGSSPGSSRTLTTSSAPVSGDLAFYWSSAGSDTTPPAINVGTVVDTLGGIRSAASLYAEVLGASGAVSATFTYTPGAPNGDYDAIIVIQP